MTGESFRFIHASDFHLERPLGDLDEVPQHLREAMAGAAWKAAATVFETAVLENVDFVLLSGDLFHPITAGPRGMAMLVEQFEQLHQQNIQVFWTTGQVDDLAKLGDGLALPPNVTVFPRDRSEQAYVRRAGDTIAVVVGRSNDGRSGLHVPSFRHDPVEEFTIALGYGTSDATALAEGRFDYWALGGEHQRRTLDGAAGVGASYCGSPQGRSLSETGAHGFHLVDIDADGSSRVHFIESDSFRYVNVELGGADLGTASDLRSLLSQRIARLQHEHGDRHLLVGWEIHLGADSPMGAGDPTELLSWLRREFGHGSPAAWSVKLDVIAPPQFPQSWLEEDTILGDFLRAAGTHRKTGGRDLQLASLTEEHPGLAPAMEAALVEADPASRAATLDHATLLGVELLRGGKPRLAMVGDGKEYR
ncbi:putative metallophosphoesterase YhaO [Rosistilla oblonga]|uniref:Putative metallophosphoesterase YhaO n=1 Tax=Rosistilla oblonga TaxID=2527990 RepID=A0A518IXK5_9BACT|nr:DNA repair exonuclease [Rosistilla oblonga]QDV13985.1 putative metallophosphoesterase YhaO [Rosistilla oblonga]QDV57822.1 putative metallophosphoesterase YhaO [Rosistilla oblonga]